MDNKFDFLKNEIIDNYFTSDIELAKTFFHKYEIKDKQKNLENFIFRIKKNVLITSILNSKVKKLFFDNKIPSKIKLSTRYYDKFIIENQSDILKINDKEIKIELVMNKFKPIQFIFNEDKLNINKNETVLIIGDLHFPFAHPKYLDFCIKMKNKYNATKIVFIGDLIDNHYQSFHPTDPDGFSAGEELRRAKFDIKKYYECFPEAIVITGNHDMIFHRKAFDSGLSKEWIKSFNEVLEVPNWKFMPSYTYNNVLYIHGTGLSGSDAAYNKALYDNKSVVMGHLHTISNINYVDQNRFGMIVGCGISFDKYAFNYARNSKKPIILSVGIVTDEGVPIIETMR